MTHEENINQIMDGLSAIDGCAAWRNERACLADSARPDIYCVCGGMAVGLYVVDADNRLSKAQRAFAEAMRDAGAVVAALRNLDELRGVLRLEPAMDWAGCMPVAEIRRLLTRWGRGDDSRLKWLDSFVGGLGYEDRRMLALWYLDALPVARIAEELHVLRRSVYRRRLRAERALSRMIGAKTGE